MAACITWMKGFAASGASLLFADSCFDLVWTVMPDWRVFEPETIELGLQGI
jgi:hypothetical protein